MSGQPGGRAGRFRELDGLRGLAAIAVVLSHYTWAYDSRYFDGGEPLLSFEEGAYGVQLFFLISGFVILMSARRASRPSDFVISRLTRLYPAYWGALAITVILAAIFHVPHVPLDTSTVILNTTMIQRWFLVPNVDDVYWTLAIEMQFYVLIFLLLVVTRTHLANRVLNAVCGVWLTVTVLVSIWASPESHGIDPQLVVTPVKLVLNAVIAEYAPLFVAGAFLLISREQGRLHPMVPTAGLVAFANSYLLRDLPHAVVVGGITALFAFVAMRDSTRILLWGPLQWYGKISYSLYITHATLGYAAIHLLVGRIGRDAAMLAAFALASALAWVLWRTAEATVSPAARRRLIQWRDRRPAHA